MGLIKGVLVNNDASARTSTAVRLRWEIALALALKIAVIIAIKYAFFNDPPSKFEVATRMAERLAGGGQAAAAAEAPRSPNDRVKP